MVKSSEVPSTRTVGIIRRKYHTTISAKGDIYIHTFVYVYTHIYMAYGTSQVALVVKNLPANVRDIRYMGWILGGEDPLEEDIATHSIILAWRIPQGRKE